MYEFHMCTDATISAETLKLPHTHIRKFAFEHHLTRKAKKNSFHQVMPQGLVKDQPPFPG
jgi:hypothetical protein